MSFFGEPRLLNEPRLLSMMRHHELDVLFITGAVNSKYLSGFFHNGADHDGTVGARPFTVLYFQDAALAPALLVPSVDLHLAKDSSWISDVRGYVSAEVHTDLDTNLYDDVFAATTAVLRDRRLKRFAVGTEGRQLPVFFADQVAAFFADQRIVDISRDIGLVRMVKTPEELRRIRRAIDVTTKAHEAFRTAARPGVTDQTLYRVAAKCMVSEGAEEAKFIYLGMGPTRYAANARFGTGYELRAGDFVRADMGASYLGYSSDFVRSYVLGATSARHRDVWTELVDTQIELANSIRLGDVGDDIYQRGRKMVSRKLGRLSREFVGHGIGLVLNEEPRMCAGNRVPIEAGTVFCVELSEYLDDGVRLHIEDMYLITETGIEMLTRDCPRDLVIPT